MAITRSSGPVLRSLSPSRRSSNSASPFASAASTFSSRPAMFFRGSTTTGSSIPKASEYPMRLSFDRPVTSSSLSITTSLIRSQVMRQTPMPSGGQKRMCMCSPSTHPGSFRCSLHKKSSHQSHQGSVALNAGRSAMTNSPVRIGTVEGDLVKRALAALIRPSSHNQRRRSAFRPRPSPLSIMTKADDNS